MRVWILLIAAVTACAQERQPGRGVNVYGREKEAKLGETLAAEVRRKSTILDNAVVREYVGQTGRRIAVQMPGYPIPYTFTVIAGDRKPLNEPIALPGGHIFVPAGLILTAHNESEFAGMLAHAIAHVAERHDTRFATRTDMANRSAVPIVYMGASIGGEDLAIPLGFLRLARSFELQADVLGAQVAAKAGYDPSGLSTYIGRVQIDRPEGIGRQFSAIPPRRLRVAELEKLIRNLPPSTYTPNDEFERIQKQLQP